VSAAAAQVAARETEGDTVEPSGATKYHLPTTLLQSFTVCGAGDKPTLLLHLLRMLDGEHQGAEERGPASLLALVFAGTVETTHRLARLLQLFGDLRGRVIEFSASLSQEQRSAALKAARKGGVSVLVSSDAAARGLDLPSLPAVIHYDVPTKTKT
jgi:superfamily II DNA/RNA helicase